MKLNEYLKSPGALTVAQLRERIGVKGDAQIRQWQYGYGDRQPGPAHAVAIERATDGRVMRWDLRPGDWQQIWPELVGREDAPAAPGLPRAAAALAPATAMAGGA